MMTDKEMNTGKWITAAASLLAFMGIGVVDPLLPSIAESIGASHSQVEMLFTAYIFTMAIMIIPIGIVAGKLGDKKLIVIGLFIVTIFALLCGLSDTIGALSIFRAGWGFGNSMFMATAMTMLIALSETPGHAIGIYEASMGLGMAFGPLLGGILGNISWRYPFFATSCLIFIAFLLILFKVKEPKKVAPAPTEKNEVAIKQMLHLFKYRPFLQIAFSGMFYYYCFFTILAYSPLILGLSAIQIGFVFFAWGLCLALGSAKISHALEFRFNSKQILKGSLLACAVILALLGFIDNIAVDIGLIVISGLILGINNALFTTTVMEHSPYARSVTSGAYNFVRWLGAAFAPLCSGLLSEALGMKMPFIVASVICLAGMGLLFIKLKPSHFTLQQSTSIESE
ncbi:multidrug efflux MFS transporter MdrL [Listeria monocytogenes]|nr:multidrug efflux MFS transporter MdrL [Listeria monocytogenes]EKL0545386.1 multidrug efflux MFS transporter MdrL [Listeria monocytogenes]EKL0582867.1 multidrug efflux MFS transporter MdrL [Listeria monocytogenes]EKL0601942.1 multidrug efflux MFS transporter MdrL [Listeria monocytogenes]